MTFVQQHHDVNDKQDRKISRAQKKAAGLSCKVKRHYVMILAPIFVTDWVNRKMCGKIQIVYFSSNFSSFVRIFLRHVVYKGIRRGKSNLALLTPIPHPLLPFHGFVLGHGFRVDIFFLHGLPLFALRSRSFSLVRWTGTVTILSFTLRRWCLDRAKMLLVAIIGDFAPRTPSGLVNIGIVGIISGTRRGRIRDL